MVTTVAGQKKGLLRILADMLDSYFGMDKRYDLYPVQGVDPSADADTINDRSEEAHETQKLDKDLFWYLGGTSCCY